MLTIIIKDSKDFGKVDQQGIHTKIESDRDIEEMCYNAERDLFDRAFVYFDGIKSGKISSISRKLLKQLAKYGDIKIQELIPEEEYNLVYTAFTYKQYQKMTTDKDGRHVASYLKKFERAAKLTKSKYLLDLINAGIVKAELVEEILKAKKGLSHG